MCQQPVQNLFTNTLGLPLRMTPDFDDNSCQMTFGVAPLPRDEDPALQKGCLSECALGKKFANVHNSNQCTIRPEVQNKKYTVSVTYSPSSDRTHEMVDVSTQN